MIYLAADIHGHIRLDWLRKELQAFPLSDEDHLIILGDAGIVWSSTEHADVLEFYEQLPCKTLFLDGNHENFTLLNKYPIINLYGGKVHRIGEKVFHLMRGEIYLIAGVRLFVFGGGFSAKKLTNTSPVFVWEEEMPSQEEYENGVANLQHTAYFVDYVLTHVPPASLAELMTIPLYAEERNLNEYLQKISECSQFQKWYFGHCHRDISLGKYVGIYNRIVKIGE